MAVVMIVPSWRWHCPHHRRVSSSSVKGHPHLCTVEVAKWPVGGRLQGDFILMGHELNHALCWRSSHIGTSQTSPWVLVCLGTVKTTGPEISGSESRTWQRGRSITPWINIHSIAQGSSHRGNFTQRSFPRSIPSQWRAALQTVRGAVMEVHTAVLPSSKGGRPGTQNWKRPSLYVCNGCDRMQIKGWYTSVVCQWYSISNTFFSKILSCILWQASSRLQDKAIKQKNSNPIKIWLHKMA